MELIILKVFGFFRWENFGRLSVWMLAFVVLGTLTYHYSEGWAWIDSLYFSVMTLTTVGYGDLTPSTTFTKIFTCFYVFGGLGITLNFVGAFFEHRQEIFENFNDKKPNR